MEKDMDKVAMKSAMAMQIKAQIIGIFGADDTTQCIAKCHSILELAGALSVEDFKVNISLKDLQKAQTAYMKLEVDEDEDKD